jgi:hypothetical protein
LRIWLRLSESLLTGGVRSERPLSFSTMMTFLPLAVPEVVQRLERHATGHRSVTDDRDDVR